MVDRINYHKVIANVNTKPLPDNLMEGHRFFLESEEFYDEDKDIKETIDLYLERLNEYLQYKKSDKEPLIRDFYNRLSKVEIASLRSTGFNAKNQKLADELKISLTEVLEFDERIRPQSKKNVSKPKPEPRQAKPRGKKEKASQEKAITEPANQVISLGEDVKFIKRFVGFHNKAKPIVSLLNFIKALQRAIVQKIVPKTSPYADDIRKIQNRAVQFYNDHAEENEIKVVINEHDLARYVGISGGEKVYKSIGFIKRFISMQGKEIELAKVDAYLKSISKANLTDEDPYFDKVQTIVDYIEKRKKGKPVKVEEQELNGLQGIVQGCGCHHLGKIYDTDMKELRPCHSKKYSDARKGACSHNKGLRKQKKCKELNGIMTAEEVAGMQYEKLQFEGRWRALLGQPATNFDMMVFGQPGSGKTTFLLAFAHYLALNFGDVLYVSGEEYNSSPLTDKVNELPSIPPNLHFVKGIKGIPLHNYRFIIMDSVTDLGIDVETYKSLREQNPDTAFILILQTTKDGKFKGGKEWEHEVEIAGSISEGVISIYKNRYGVKGVLDFFNN